MQYAQLDVDKFDFTTTCPVCRSGNLLTPYVFGEFSVLKCRQCDSSWRSNMYNNQKLAEIYCDSDYDLHPYFDRDKSDEEALTERRYRDYVRGLSKLGQASNRRLLDVGAGSGTFLRIARKAGWEVEGVEMSPKLARLASSNGQIPVHSSAFEDIDLPPASFDAITFWDIIEHVIDPRAVVQRAVTLLKPGGAILFCTPNEKSILPRVGRLLYHVGVKYPALALHPTNHTYFFSKSGFRDLLEESGLGIRKIYSQAAYFDHSPLASKLQKAGILVIESVASVIDRQYEMVFIATKPMSDNASAENNT